MTFFFNGRVSNKFYCTNNARLLHFKLPVTVCSYTESVLSRTIILRQFAKAIKLWRFSLTDVFQIDSIEQKTLNLCILSYLELSAVQLWNGFNWNKLPSSTGECYIIVTYFFNGRVSNRFYCTNNARLLHFKLSGTLCSYTESVLSRTIFLRQFANAIKLWRYSLTDVFQIHCIAQKTLNLCILSNMELSAATL